MYEIYLERRAERDIRKLPRELGGRIIQEIMNLAQNPRPTQARKITRSLNDWRLRVGDHRVLYEINDKDKIITILKIRHRREAY
ncbi:MAG: type II toxin-antitoxin system RelE/ParE family toxin [Deltaproteobacteria bacterium]|nr:type II toxin-antitoxin system RelE/ParE family toxin [Deltaproteobacteria bacterium]